MTGGQAPTRALRRAGVLSLAAQGLFGVSCAVTTQAHAVRLTNPWNAGLYDAVVSCAILVLPFVAAPTGVRLLAHRGPAPVPAATARAVLAGCLTALACMAVALVACTGALADVPTGQVPMVAAALLAASTVAGVAAALLTLRARDAWLPALARLDQVPAVARPDLADEVATLTASLLPGSTLARLAAWLDRGLDVWRVSPRRHPWAAVVATAAVTGLLLAQWHVVREGPWEGPEHALTFAGAVAVTVGCGLAACVAWLGVIRPVPPQRTL